MLSPQIVEELFLQAFPGAGRSNLVHGFRVWNGRKQFAALYFGELAEGNWLEIALDPAALAHENLASCPASWVQAWVKQQQQETGCPAEEHSATKRWPTIGFATEAQFHALLMAWRDFKRTPHSPAPAVPVKDILLEAYRKRVSTLLGSTEAETLVRRRIGQDLLRDQLRLDWGDACAVTGLALPALLRASHIKPWAQSSDAERLDPDNALLLAPQLDAAFDRGLLSFTDQGQILFADALDAAAQALLGLSPTLRLRRCPSPEQKAYLTHHRQHCFRPSCRGL